MMKKLFSSSVAMNVVWLLGIVIIYISAPSSPFTDTYPESDSAVFITCAHIIDHGGTIYVDFFDHKGPLIYMFDLLGLKIGGIAGLWVLEIIWLLLAANVMYLVCRVYSSTKASFIATCCGVLAVLSFGCHNSVELVALPFVCLGILPLAKALHTNRNASVLSALVSTLCLCATLLLKPNIAAPIGLFMLWTVIRCASIMQWKQVGIYALVLLSTLSCVCIGLYLCLSHIGAWNDFVSQYWTFNLDYTNIFPLTVKLQNGLSLAFCTIVCAASWLVVAFVLFQTIKSRCNVSETIMLLAVLLLSTFFECGLAGNRFAHYLIVLVPLFAIFFGRGIDLTNSIISSVIIGTLLLVIPLKCMVNMYVGLHNVDSSAIRGYEAAAAYIRDNSEPTDRVCLYNVNPLLYYLSDRQPASKYIYQWVVFEVRQTAKDEYFDAIRTNCPTLILTTEQHIDMLPRDIISNYSQDTIPGCSIVALRAEQR